ncbi:MAG: EAL domain-containing protein [Chloroflexi bacterium]|nr:MAG: EAL domain-containing protein [Chloroflexota bacterium]
MNKSITNLLKTISSDPEKGQKQRGFLYSLLQAPTFEDTAKNRLANLQNRILIALFVTSLLAVIILVWNWSDTTPASLEILLLGNGFFVLAFFYQRRGHIERASWILVGTVYIFLLFTVLRTGFGVSSIIQAALLISLAGLLLHSFNVLTVMFVALVTLVASQSIFPATQITQNQFIFAVLVLALEGLLLTAASHTLEQSFSEVDRSKQDILQANQDLKDLSLQLATRTETLVAEVENRNAAEQTVLRQNRLLTAAAEIASATTSTLDVSKLLITSTELIQEKFGFYHTSVFLIESGSNTAVLRASAGEGGHRLPVDQHQLVVGSKSLVGMATATHRPVVVMDVAKHPTHLKNPQLPNTQSEAVIPLLIGELVIGALDVQSTLVDAFSDWDITVLTTIANQLAIAVQNARLYTSVRQEVVERRRAEQALQFAKEALEIQVKARTAELSQANEQLSIELAAREKNETLFRILFELSPDAVVLIDPYDPNILWPIIDCNVAAGLMSGYHRDELVGHPIDILNLTPATEAGQSAYLKELREAGIFKFETYHRRKNGEVFPIEVSTTLITIGGRELIIGIDRDISERKRAEAELEQSVSALHATLEATADGILVVDGQGKIVNFNRRFTEMWHIPDAVMESQEDDQALAFVLDQLVDPKSFVTKVQEVYSQMELESLDMLLFKDGRVFERYSRPQLIGGQNVGRVWSFHDITQRKQAEEKLIYTALHDPLTNLPNRVLFMDRLQHAMERAKRHKDYKFAVLYLDLDRFKVVNDSLGHAIGDLLLIQSALRLASCLRSEDTIARLGGDEFVILLEDIQDAIDVTHIANRIQADLALPYDLEGHKVFVSVSMGIVLNAARYEQPDNVLRDADIAMYRAKGQGRGRYEMFDTAMLARAMTRLELETDLRKALECKEFIVHYQPIVELGTRRIVGFEALVRWQHPTRGLVMPSEFIPTAEETGIIVPIGHWVLVEACRQICEWQEQFPADPPLTVSVNLSARQCSQTDLVQKVAGVLQKTGLPASNLKLELTESMIVEDAESTSAMLSELRALGVQVQIDDFGTGYSSLGYLQRLPIDTLKIDRTFVSRIGKNGSGSEIIQTILILAHDLGMKVIAEGIETDEQLSKLKSMECEYGQGYLFTKPVDSQTIEALLVKSFTQS